MTTPRKILWSFAVLLSGSMTFASSAMAGFQYSAPPAPVAPQPAPAQNYNQPIDNNAMAPMPIVPAAPVEAQQLPPLTGNTDVDRMNATVASIKPVYGDRPQTAAPRAPGQGLVINPYPLQQNEATHGVESGQLALDQALLEQSGQLKTVSTPGSNSASDMIARGKIISRYDRTVSVQPPKPVSRQLDYGSSDLTPIPGGEGDTLYPQQGGGQLMAPAAIAPVARQPVMPQPAIPYPQVATQAEPVQPPLQSSNGLPQAVGFGRDLPLALALSQILPPDYSFSFAQNVNAGETVSWQGGKSFDAVLQDMLTPLGMRAVIAGKQVVIQTAG